MPSKKARAKKPSTPSFEESIDELEEILDSIENEQLPLEDLVSKYEKGARLLNHCNGILSSARKRLKALEVEQIKATEDAADEPENHLTDSESDDTDPHEDDDDIRLL